MARKTISKTTRFEVFKRDGFKCMYCGAEAPTVVLHVDHVKPVAKGGENDMLNYVTACEGCNLGKGARILSDDSAIAKQRRQLDELNERREQLEMMLQWRDGLSAISGDKKAAIREHFSKHVGGFSIKPESKLPAEWLRKYDLSKILDAVELAAEKYVRIGADGKITAESAEDALKKVGGILNLESQSPDIKRLHYIRGILRNRVYVPFDILDTLKHAAKVGVPIDEIEHHSKTERNWTNFREWLEAEVEDRE